MMVTIYPKSGSSVTVYDAVKTEYSKVPGTAIPRLVCYDAGGREVASFMVSEISGHLVVPDEAGPSVG